MAQKSYIGAPSYLIQQGDIIPKTWTEVVAGLEYKAADGTKLTAMNSSHSGAYPPCACDSDLTSKWGCTGKTVWLKLQFPQPVKINKLKIKYGDILGGDSNLNYFKIQVSNDNNTWLDIYETNAYCYSETQITIDAPGMYSYYRFLGNRTTGYGNDFQIFHIEVMEYAKALDTNSNKARQVSKIYVGTEKAKLPNGYTPVEYIESSGTQYIDTEFKPNQNTRVVANFRLLSHPNTAHAIFGTRETGSTKCFYWFYHATQKCFFGGYGSDKDYHWDLDDVTGKKTIDFNKNFVTVNTATYTYTTQTFQSSYNLTLFALNEANTIKFQSNTQLFSCQIYDNGTLIRDFVPCINAANVAGLYDIVNNKFYTNAGTGSFAAGEKAPGIARMVKKGYIGDVNNKAKLFYSNVQTFTLLARCTNYTMNPTQIFINDEHAVTIALGGSIEESLQVPAGAKVTFRLTSREADLTVASNNTNDPTKYPYWTPTSIKWFKDTNEIYGSSYVAYSFYMPESDAEIYVRYGTGVIT